MGSHPINLGLRFILELFALGAAGFWGYSLSTSWTKYLWMIIIPLFMMALWGTFAVPDDPSRSGNAPIVTPGLIRLVLELAFFAFATWALYAVQHQRYGLIFGCVVLLHYIASYDRVLWLLKH